MIIQLVDRNPGMCLEWAKQFGDTPDVNINRGDFFALETDCVVSPANSFGFMDGGLDYAISMKLGWDVQERLQQEIRDHYKGELLVGEATLIHTNHNDIPYLISAPTMRVPMILGPESYNVYLAARAIFRLLKETNHPIEKVTISGLGTGVGRVPFETCARQMKTAYDEVFLDKGSFPHSWREAQRDHVMLFSKIDRDLQY